MIPADVLDAIRDALPVSQVVSRRVRLKRAGRIWKGLCPLHKEQTPSFTCDDQRGTWHCFGCGEGGDVIEWLRRSSGLSFAEAMEQLAKETGITIPAASPEHARQQARRLSDLEVLDRARLYYQQQLPRHPEVLAYLERRGVTDDAIREFGLGYAPEGLEGVAAAVGSRDAGAAADGLSRTGLVSASGRAQIRSRLIFPIADARGRTVGFAGRALDDRQPKYLNTPETELFRKGNLLYGAHLARQKAHDGEPLVIVEGYMDVIACWQGGVAAVAPMGTALTEAQLRAAWRLSDRPILMLDGDQAGRVATRRALAMGLAHLAPGVTLQACPLRRGVDPGHYLGTPDAIKSLLLGAPRGLADAIWLAWSEGVGTDPDSLGRLEADLVEAVSKIPSEQLREKYLADMRSRVRSMQQPRRVVRSNGHSLHSTNPATRRLLRGIESNGMSLREAVLVHEVWADGGTELQGLEEAQAVYQSVGLTWGPD